MKNYNIKKFHFKISMNLLNSTDFVLLMTQISVFVVFSFSLRCILFPVFVLFFELLLNRSCNKVHGSFFQFLMKFCYKIED